MVDRGKARRSSEKRITLVLKGNGHFGKQVKFNDLHRSNTCKTLDFYAFSP